MGSSINNVRLGSHIRAFLTGRPQSPAGRRQLFPAAGAAATVVRRQTVKGAREGLPRVIARILPPQETGASTNCLSSSLIPGMRSADTSPVVA